MKDKKDSTLLHVAAFNNDLVKMKIFLQHYKAYCEVTHGNKMYETGFEIKVKAWINIANKEGLTAMHFAALHGNTDIIKLL
jgi:ankyrin repeat protein